MAHGTQLFTVTVGERQLHSAWPVFLAAGRHWMSHYYRHQPILRSMHRLSCVLAWMLAILGTLMLYVSPRDRPLYWAASVGGLAYALFLQFVGYDRLVAFRQRGWGQRILAWRVRRVFDAAIAKAPLTIHYEISPESIRSTCPELGTHRHIRSERIVHAYATRELLIVLVRGRFRKMLLTHYLADDRLETALKTFLASNEIPVIELPPE